MGKFKVGFEGDEDVWCHDCQSWSELISPEEVN